MQIEYTAPKPQHCETNAHYTVKCVMIRSFKLQLINYLNALTIQAALRCAMNLILISSQTMKFISITQFTQQELAHRLN